MMRFPHSISNACINFSITNPKLKLNEIPMEIRRDAILRRYIIEMIWSVKIAQNAKNVELGREKCDQSSYTFSSKLTHIFMAANKAQSFLIKQSKIHSKKFVLFFIYFMRIVRFVRCLEDPSNILYIVVNQWTWWDKWFLCWSKVSSLQNIFHFSQKLLIESWGQHSWHFTFIALLSIRTFSAKFNTPMGYTLFHLKSRHKQTANKCILISFMYSIRYMYIACNNVKHSARLWAKNGAVALWLKHFYLVSLRP